MFENRLQIAQNLCFQKSSQNTLHICRKGIQCQLGESGRNLGFGNNWNARN